MARMSYVGRICVQQERFFHGLRALLIKRCTKLAARAIVRECFEQLRNGAPVPDVEWKLESLPLYGVDREAMNYARDHGLEAFAAKILRDLDDEVRDDV